MLYKFLLIFLLLFSVGATAQHDTLATQQPVTVADPARGQDSLHRLREDSVKKAALPLSWQQDTAYTRFYKNLTPPGKKQAVYLINALRKTGNNDEVFYMLAGLVLLVALIRTSFPKYFQNVFRLFFQTSYRQKQSKESLQQEHVPALLLNIAFILIGGLLVAILLKDTQELQHFYFWLLWLYASGVLAIIYIGKYLFISFCGWAFNVQQAAFNYRFIVFLVNKMASICLLPVLMLLAFANGSSYDTIATIALSIVGILLIYRYVLALSTVGKNLKVHALHFFIYLCAVEILPLLVIYKLLFIATGK